MGNCCKLLKRSRYRKEEKSVDPVGYKKTSNYNIESPPTQNTKEPQRRTSNGFLIQHNQGNINPLAFHSDNSLNNKNKILKTSQLNNQQQANGIVNGLNGSSFKQKNSNTNSNPVTIQPGMLNGYDNKIDDVNVSIPHIADFYPEGTFLFQINNY